MFVMPLVLAAVVQQQMVLPPPPRTHLEAMLLQAGAVVVQGSSLAGFVRGLDGSSVRVEVLDVTDTANNTKEYGFNVEVRQPSEHAPRVAIAYVDYDEIAPLIAALDRLIAMNNSVTRLEHFEGDYRTAGDLRVSVFSTRDGGVFAAVAAGLEPIQPLSSASFHIADLQLLRNLFAQGKATLDTARQ